MSPALASAIVRGRVHARPELAAPRDPNPPTPATRAVLYRQLELPGWVPSPPLATGGDAARGESGDPHAQQADRLRRGVLLEQRERHARDLLGVARGRGHGACACDGGEVVKAHLDGDR